MLSTQTKNDRMYTAAPARTGAWPLAAICCLGLLGLLIAATIVLALIPVYLPGKGAVAANNNNNNGNNTFYLEYAGDPDANSSVSGSLENLSEVSNTLGFGNDATVNRGFTKATFDRRKRSLLNRRQKRTIIFTILLEYVYTFRIRCNTRCQLNQIQRVNTGIQTRINSIPKFPCRVRFDGQLRAFTISVRLVRVVTTNFGQLLLGYGVVTSLTFVAVRSGPFNDPLTWSNGIVPFSGCSVVIPAGIVVTLARAVLEFPINSFDIFGTIAFGSGSSSFTLNYPSAIFVHSGGIIQDLTSGRLLLIPPSSLIVVYNGGAFSSAGTVIQTYTSSGLGSSVRVTTAAGPFTCGVLSDGTLLSFTKVTYIVTQSGGFTFGTTFLGGFAPSSEGCSSGCGLYVPSGYTLSTADLNGILNLQIDEIYVAAGGRFELGTVGSSSGFRFSYRCQIDVYGTLAFVGSLGGGIYIPGLGFINIYTGGIFTSTVVTFIQAITAVTFVNIGVRFTLAVFIAGPYFITITIIGIITVSVTSPGGSTLASSTISTAISTATRTTTAISTATRTTTTAISTATRTTTTAISTATRTTTTAISTATSTKTTASATASLG